MSVIIRYRLIQILEILLWLGAVAGIAMVASRVWPLREQGVRAMLDAATPSLLAIGAAMAALIVLIGIYHNSRRSAEAMDRMSRQGAGGMRRLPGAVRGADAIVSPAPVQPAPVQAAVVQPAPVPVAPVVAAPAPAPAAPPAPQPVAPAPAASAPVMAEPEPALVTPHIVAATPAPQPTPQPTRVARPVMRSGIRRLGPAN